MSLPATAVVERLPGIGRTQFDVRFQSLSLFDVFLYFSEEKKKKKNFSEDGGLKKNNNFNCRLLHMWGSTWPDEEQLPPHWFRSWRWFHRTKLRTPVGGVSVRSGYFDSGEGRVEVELLWYFFSERVSLWLASLLLRCWHTCPRGTRLSGPLYSQ